MKKILLFVAVSLTVWLGLFSCENHTDEFDNSPKVGSILLSSGTVVSSEGSPKLVVRQLWALFSMSRGTRFWSSVQKNWEVMPMPIHWLLYLE